MTTQFSISMNVLKYDESPSRTGANGFLHNGQRDRPMTLNLSLIPEYRPAVSECDAADMTPLIFYLCDSQHPPPNRLPDVSRMGVAPTNATTWFSDADGPLLYCPCYRQDHTEGASLVSSPSPFRPPFDQRNPSLTEGSSSPLCLSCFEDRPCSYALSTTSLRQDGESDHFHLSPALPRTPGTEINLWTEISHDFAPLPGDLPSTSTGEISWIGSHRCGSDDFDASLTATISNGSTQDNRTATTSPDTRSMYSTSPTQSPVTFTNSAIHPTNKPSNRYNPLYPYSDHGDMPAPSEFQSASRGRQHFAIVPFIAPSQVSAAHRNPKKYWCQACNAGFSQKQGLRRHDKDVHFSRRPCPYCKDFQWSLGRKYALRNHLKAKHSKVAFTSARRL